MTNWKEIRHKVQYRVGGKSRSQEKSEVKGKDKHKNKKEITPQESVALTASIIIILMALGGIGLVYNVLAQLA